FPSFSQDVSRLSIAFKGGAKVFTLATGEETVLPPAPQTIDVATLTPDGKRIVGVSNSGIFVAAVAEREWNALTTDPYAVRGISDFPTAVAVSPDSRIIAANSLSAGVVEAVDGEPVRVVSENGAPLFYATPVFEPA